MQIINNLWQLLSKLKDCEFYTKEFFRVLAEIVQEFRALACKLINVRGGLINAVIKGFISNETTDRAFSTLSIGKDRVNPAGSGIELSYRRPCVLIEFIVLQQ